LAHNAAHGLDILLQGAGGVFVRQSLDPRAKYGERRAQLVGGVGGEFLLPVETPVEAGGWLVDWGDGRENLLRDSRPWQSDVGSGRADMLGPVGCTQKRLYRTTEDHDVDGKQQQQNWNSDPGDLLKKVCDDIVDQHIAMREVLGDLYPHRAMIDVPARACPRNDAVPARRLEKNDLGWKVLDRNDRRSVRAR